MGNEEERKPNNFHMCVNMIGKEMQSILNVLKTCRQINEKMNQFQLRYLIYDFWEYYYNSNLTQVNPYQINSNNFNPNLFNIQTNALINANYLLKAKIDLLNTIKMNLGTNLSNINPNLNIESSNENKNEKKV